MKAWLASEGFESAFLDKDKATGIPPGAEWERTLYRAVEQSQAVIIIQTPNWLASKWCFAEFTQARALGKAIFPAIVAPTGDTLISPDIQALNLLSDRDGGLERLKRELVRIALDAQGGFAWDASRPPFPGLLAFEEEDAAVYFGRDDDIRRLIERLDARRAQGGAKLIALLGSSGSGKSSLLRAGVIPRLKRAGRNWIVVPPMRPRLHPVDELATALATARDPPVDWAKVRDDLIGSDPARALEGFSRSLRGEARANEAQILIPIDQAEELFGVADPDEARRFLAILSQALSESLPFMAVMTIRSDFLGQLQSATSLTARFEEFSLGPMPLARIPQIIEGPARAARAYASKTSSCSRPPTTRRRKTPCLCWPSRCVSSSIGRKTEALTLQAYKALGDEAARLTPLENAVRKAADTVLAEANATDEELTALREAFVPAMVRVNEQGEYVAPSGADGRVAGRRRIRSSSDWPRRDFSSCVRTGDARVVEVAHEALLRKWPWLKERLDAERVFLIGKQQLEQDLRDWQAAAEKDKADALLTGLKLTRARAWLVDHPTRLTAEERAFVQASVERGKPPLEQDLRDWQAAAEKDKNDALLTGLRLTRARAWLVEHPTGLTAEERAFVQVSVERDEAEKRRRERTRRTITWGSIAAAIFLAVVAAGAFWEFQAAHVALKDAEAAHAQTAKELIRYTWIDLGAQQAEVDRLTDVARSLKIDPETVLPNLVCANQNCTETKRQQPGEYDCGTWLPFGFRYLYCTIRPTISFDKVQSISGLKIYLPGGPHEGKELNLKDPERFGHYNPRFLDWVENYIIPIRGDQWFRGVTQRAYARWIGPTVRALYRTHQLLFVDVKGFDDFRRKYQAVKKDYQDKFKGRLTNEGMFAKDPVPFESVKLQYKSDTEAKKENLGFALQENFRWLSDYLSAPEFKAINDDWYLENTAGGFWVRRSLDGTEPQIFSILHKVLSTFEPSVLDEP